MNAETQAERDAEDCTVVTCSKCSLVNMVAVTSRLDKVLQKELGQMAAAGCSVRHMPITEARKQKWCECCT